jgi:hypothetical protein
MFLLANLGSAERHCRLRAAGLEQAEFTELTELQRPNANVFLSANLGELPHLGRLRRRW